ncbi:hypothetical protein AAFC03_002470 [Enterococcus faecium]
MDESLKTEIIESTKEDFPDLSEERITNLLEILYLIFDYPHKHYTFKHFEV